MIPIVELRNLDADGLVYGSANVVCEDSNRARGLGWSEFIGILRAPGVNSPSRFITILTASARLPKLERPLPAARRRLNRAVDTICRLP